MPPHARMSLTQQLLVRALIAWFWKEPYHSAADPLGHAFARPVHAAVFCREGLSRSAPGFESRGLRLRIRMVRAAFRVSLSRFWIARSTRGFSWKSGRPPSPGMCWARRPTAGGTARYVDSSVERVQVKAEGLLGDRYRGDMQRAPRALCTPPANRRSGWAACAIGLGSRLRACIPRFRCTRRWFSTFWIPGRAAPWAAAPITSRIRAGELRDLPGERQRSRGAAPGSFLSLSAIRLGRCGFPPPRTIPSFRLHSICDDRLRVRLTARLYSATKGTVLASDIQR